MILSSSQVTENMTAIFAYAQNDIAFVAGDSLRNITLLGPTTVQKVHQWSPTVVFAQAGDGTFQSRLIANVLTLQPNLVASHPNDPDDVRLIHSYTQLWPTYWAQASAYFSKLASGNAHIRGTILVAAAADNHGPARIHAIDFATGQVKLCAGSIEAEGTDPPAFSALAQTLYNDLYVPNTAFAIDDWALRCIDTCVASHPNDVGWPADLAIARSSNPGAATLQRFGSHSLAGQAAFLI